MVKLAAIQRILDSSVLNFQKQSLHGGKETLMGIIDWYKQTLLVWDVEDIGLLTKRKRMIASLEVVQRELKVLTLTVDRLITSLKNER
jgi:hypothetical protein